MNASSTRERPTVELPQRPALRTRFVRFALVGGVGFVVDFAVFNALILTVLSHQVWHEGPLVAKVISTTLAIIVNWIGNRVWAFRSQRRDRAMEFVEFLITSLLGMGVALLCLWVSHYLLGFTGVVADNISSQGVGLVLGSALRYVIFELWVFSPRRQRRG
jgi:putative flippase GtrA